PRARRNCEVLARARARRERPAAASQVEYEHLPGEAARSHDAADDVQPTTDDRRSRGSAGSRQASQPAPTAAKEHEGASLGAVTADDVKPWADGGGHRLVHLR